VAVTERLVTAAELGQLLGFSAATIVDWFERGEIPGFKLGGRLRFRESEVLQWLEGKRAGAGGEVAPVPFQTPARGPSLTVAPVPFTGGED
jgi:excisionase family DNA binding protein